VLKLFKWLPNSLKKILSKFNVDLIFLVLVLILVQTMMTSCSSLNKSRVYAGLGGALAGAGVGAGVGEVIGERNGYKKRSNVLGGAAIGAASGAIFGVMLANFFWNEDPENREMKQMIIKSGSAGSKKDDETAQAIADLPPTSDIFAARQKALVEIFKQQNPNAKVYDVTSEPLPDDLKDEVMKQKIIIYDIPEQVVKLPDGRTILIKKTSAKEHYFEESKH
jgi:hypothetical protein